MGVFEGCFGVNGSVWMRFWCLWGCLDGVLVFMGVFGWCFGVYGGV